MMWIGIIIWAIVHAGIIFYSGYSWQIAIYDSILSTSLLALFSQVGRNIFRFHQPTTKTLWKIGLLCFSLSAIWIALLRVSIKYLLKFDNNYIINFDQTIPIRFIISFLVIGCTILVVWIWELLKFEKEQQNRKALAETLSKEAELESITQQLQPHFLFNSLNSINALISSKPAEAQKMVMQLSDFLRGTLKKKEKPLVSFDEELKQINLYLEIEMVRFGHRLKTEFVTDFKTLTYKVPHLILQPLVENAIKYGLYETIGDVKIEIISSIENEMLKVEIKNPIDSAGKNRNFGEGFGLSSVQRRLNLMYSRNDLLKTSEKNNIFSAVIYIPQIK
ncbi:MAG: histidine kinase [Bacteroidetes bacterium]|nr:histidine kinase [Bacteroidota bacterium]